MRALCVFMTVSLRFHEPKPFIPLFFPSDRQFCGDMSISLGCIPETFSPQSVFLRCAASLIPFVKGLYDGPPFLSRPTIFYCYTYAMLSTYNCIRAYTITQCRGSVTDRSWFAHVGISGILCDSEASLCRSYRSRRSASA